MSPHRLTELDTGHVIQHNANSHAGARQKDWWTGRTYFLKSGTGELKHALAARKGKPQRSKARSQTEPIPTN